MSRAEAIRRHRWNPGLLAALKHRIRGLALEDRSAKDIALTVELSAGKACRWLHVLGFRRMYVTADERAAVMAMRAEKEKAEGARAA